MALLRLIYDSVVFLTFYVSGVCMYYHHKSYEYSTHPLTVITCKIGAIMQIILSMNLFFSSYTNNFIYIVNMIDVGSKRYIEENDEKVVNEPENEVSNALENQGNAPLADVENKDKDAAKEIPPVNGAKIEVEAIEEKQGAAVDVENEAHKDHEQEAALHDVEEIAPARVPEK